MTRTAGEELRAATDRLKRAGIAEPARDARRILAFAMDVPPDRLTLHLDATLSGEACLRLRRFLERRAGREPVSRIVGGRWFHDHWFMVTPDVLDPRPETEILVEHALSEPFRSVLDLGVGSGCILLSLLAARPAAVGLGVDVSPGALRCAARNAETIGVADRVRFQVGNWFAPVEGQFDLITSNPPYVSPSEMDSLAPEVRDHDPREALTDGRDGLSAYRIIAADAGAFLVPGGRLLVEIGATQGRLVTAIFREAGLTGLAVHDDLDGRNRVVEARKSA